MSTYTPGIRNHWKSVSFLTLLLLAWTFYTPAVEAFLGMFFPKGEGLVYTRTPLGEFLLQHLALVAGAGVVAILIGSAAGLFVLSPLGKPFRDIIIRLANLGQAVPSIAIMAIAVPAMGYGSEPVILALVIYSVLPVMVNVVAGISAVPEAAVEAGRGMGMTRTQRLFQIEVPLAMPVIMTGLRTMLVILVSAATLGAVVGAGGLGVPIMSGIAAFNNAIVAHGAVPAILLALIVDRAL